MSLIPKDAKHSCITSLHHFCGKWILGAKITKQEQAKKNIRLASAPLFTSHLQINRAYCLVLMSNKKKQKTNHYFPFSLHPRLPLLWWSDEESSKGEASAKKRRVETFQQKEKRKRDMGQATSDKNFVEEEKRILRQNAEWGLNRPQQGIFFLFKQFMSAEKIHRNSDRLFFPCMLI